MNTLPQNPTHGLLAEDFKQNLLNTINNHPLDMQTKAIIAESLSMQLQFIAKTQTEKELKEYKASLNSAEADNHNNHEEVSELRNSSTLERI